MGFLRIFRYGVSGWILLLLLGLCPLVFAEGAKTAEEYVHEALRSINRKDFKEALTQLDQAIGQDDKQAAAYFHRGMLLLQMNDLKGAETNFNKAMKLRPDFGSIYLGKGVIAYRRGRFEESADLLSQAIKRDPSSGMAFYNRGVVFYQQGKYAVAEKDLNRALELGIEVDPDLYEEIWTLNHLDEVIADTDEKIRQEPNSAEAYYNRGIAYYYKKDFLRSRTDLEKAKSLGIEVEDDLIQEIQAAAGPPSS